MQKKVNKPAAYIGECLCRRTSLQKNVFADEHLAVERLVDKRITDKRITDKRITDKRL